MPDLSSYRFSATHEWVRLDDGGAVIGISDHAQAELGDVIFVELPAVGTVLASGDKFGAIESVKAASDLFAPVGGTVAAVNKAIEDAPELVNNQPYEGGWMLRLEPVDETSAALMDESAYNASIGE